MRTYTIDAAEITVVQTVERPSDASNEAALEANASGQHRFKCEEHTLSRILRSKSLRALFTWNFVCKSKLQYYYNTIYDSMQ